jgi:Cu/Ag efflux pump CusA
LADVPFVSSVTLSMIGWVKFKRMVSTGVGFATLFGIAIMDGVLMFKGITKYRLQGASVDEAIIHGRIDS